MSISYAPRKIIQAGNAGTDITSASCDLSQFNAGSIQLIWSGLTGTLDGKLTVEVSDDGVNWDVKKLASGSDAIITVSGAAGNDVLTIEAMTEKLYRAKWAKTGVTAGVVTAILMAKGS
jgi:hypothetical protein